jgi:hypothetical protein
MLSMIMFMMIITVFSLIILMMLALCMLKLVGANLISGLIRIAKILQVRINCWSLCP